MPDEHAKHENGNIADNRFTINGGDDTIPTSTLDSFREVRNNGTFFADKSELIERILSDKDAKVFLFCRPRRFGKSINLTMLDSFLNIGYKGNTWFNDLYISKIDTTQQFRNRFPVIYLNMIGKVYYDAERLKRGFDDLIIDTFDKFNYLQDSERLTDRQKRKFCRVLNDEIVNPEDLAFLAECLHAHHGVPAIVLIDEYDAPVINTLGRDTFRDTVDVLKGILTPLFKSNEHVHKAVLFGVLQVAKESLFSGLNNVKVSSVFDDRGYGDLFGLTEGDVMMACAEAGHPEKIDEIRRFYDGYRIGDHHVYNPYSVMNYFENGMKLSEYWVGTSAEDHIRDLLSKKDERTREILLRLSGGESANVTMSSRLAFPVSGRIEDMEPGDVLSLLAQTGYLTVERIGYDEYNVRIPNQEIRNLFNSRLRNWLGNGWYSMNTVLDSLLNGKPGDAITPIMNLFQEMMNKNNETLWSSYQLILSGFLAHQNTHMVLPEHFSGDGVTDISVIPRDDGPAAIIEFKKTSAAENVRDAAAKALKQILERRYALGMKGDPIHTYGFAVGPSTIVICSENGTYSAEFPECE